MDLVSFLPIRSSGCTVHYKKKKTPDRNTILDIVKNMKENGSVGTKVQKKRSNTSRNQNP